MSKFRSFLVTAFVLLLLSGSGGAAWWFLAGPGSKEDAAQQVARVDKMAEVARLSSLSEHIALAFSGNDLPMSEVSPDTRLAIRKVMSQAFSAQRLEQKIKSRLIANYNRKHVQGITDFADSRAGRHILEIELQPEPSQAEALGSIQELMQHPPSQERRQLLDRLARATRSSETLSNMTVSAINMYVQAIPADSPPDLKQWAEELSGQRDAMQQQQMDQMMPLMFALQYREASDSELEKNVRFSESAAGQWLNTHMLAAMQEEMDDAAMRITQGMKPILAQLKAKSAAKQPPVSFIRPLLPDPVAAPEKFVAAAEPRSPRDTARALPHRAYTGRDVRNCLDAAGDAEIIACAERYR